MTVKQRLIQFLKYEELGQKKFAQKVGLSDGYVNAIRVSIQPDTLYKIAMQFPNLNTGWLMTGEGTMLKTPLLNENISELKEKTYLTHIEVRLVSTNARAGYSESYYSDEYLNDMPTLLIESDKDYHGKYLAFEVDGDSMEPEYHKGDIVICREIKRELWKDKLHYKEWDFVIAHGTKGIMLKQIVDQNIENGEIVCHSLNQEEHPDFILNLREVSFLYNVVEHRIPGKNKLRYR